MATADLANLYEILVKILKLPKEKQMLVAGFVEGVQYDEIKKPEEAKGA